MENIPPKHWKLGEAIPPLYKGLPPWNFVAKGTAIYIPPVSHCL